MILIMKVQGRYIRYRHYCHRKCLYYLCRGRNRHTQKGVGGAGESEATPSMKPSQVSTALYKHSSTINTSISDRGNTHASLQ